MCKPRSSIHLASLFRAATGEPEAVFGKDSVTEVEDMRNARETRGPDERPEADSCVTNARPALNGTKRGFGGSNDTDRTEVAYGFGLRAIAAAICVDRLRLVRLGQQRRVPTNKVSNVMRGAIPNA